MRLKKHIVKKKILTLIITLLLSAVSYAQTTETFDIATYQPPQGFKRTTGQGYVLFQDSINDGFCILVIYASRNSSGDADKDFDKEWKDLVVKPNGSVPQPKIQKQKTPEGWTAVTGITSVTENNVEYALMLITSSGFEKTISVLVKAAGEDYLPVIGNFLSTMQLNSNSVPTHDTSTPTMSTAAPQVDKTIVGRWGKSQSVVGAYANEITTNLAFSGYKKGEYTFKADGTYTFQGENWGGQIHNEEFGLKNEKEWGLIDEIGSYEVNGKQLIIIPKQNVYRIVESDGKLKKSGSLGLEKRTYTWQTYYAEGMEETRLVLTASKTNSMDGEFSTYEPAVSFPNSFCYALNKNMFFKFLPMN